jgi:uncharacterized surface anchored protein
MFLVTQLSHWEQHLIDPDGNDLGEVIVANNGDILNAGNNGYLFNVTEIGDDQLQWLEIRQTEVVGTFLSEAPTGNIPVGELEPGSYTIEEIVPPLGYALQENPHERIQSFDIPREGEYEVSIVFANKPYPGVTILKFDEKTGLPLNGAEFSIKINGNIAWQGIVQNGMFTLPASYIPPDFAGGWFEATELAAPYGYEIKTESQSAYIEPGGSYQFKFDNRQRPSLQIVKRNALTGLPVAGAVFEIWSEDGHFIGDTAATNGLGETNVIYNLSADTVYRVQEKSVPYGYILDTTPKYVRLEWGGDGPKKLEFSNYPMPGLMIIKRDEQTKAPLDGAIFSVAEKGGKVVWTGPTENGVIYKEALLRLPEGWYTITEVSAPDHYLITEKSQDVYLSADMLEPVSVTFLNRPKPTLTIQKYDTSGKPLAGAVFRVWETEGSSFDETRPTDENGQIVITDLEERIYSVQEISAPNVGGTEYIADAERREILLDSYKPNKLVFFNQKKPTLTVVKLDELTDNPIAGASFQLRKTEGEKVGDKQVTDANGRITWTNLDPGIYTLEEIDEPYGYFKDPERREILLAGDEDKTLEFFNRPRPVLRIFKTDAVTDEAIQGVKFKVQKAEGATIGEFSTDADGMIELSPATGYLLEEAIYTVTEITPPNEYLLSDNPVKQAMLKWYEPTDFRFENLRKPTLIFIKTNALTTRGITGATYKVEYESATGGITSLGTYKTKCGLIVIPHVLPGWYILTETIPAAGYSLPTNPVHRLHLAPGENGYTYDETHEDLYVDERTNPANGSRGSCGDWCGYLCSKLCGGSCGVAAGFENIKIYNGYGELLGTGTTVIPAPPDIIAPSLTAGNVIRVSDTSATVQFYTNEAGRYYYTVASDGATAPTISTSGSGTSCAVGWTTLTLTVSSGARDFYVKVKDAAGNVSGALKIDIPAYVSPTPPPAAPPEEPTAPEDPEPPEEPVPPSEPASQGGIIYLNPEFSYIKVIFGTSD